MTVKYSDSSGNKSIWSKNQEELLNDMKKILADYQAQNITLTNRQLYYQLVSKGLIPNADEIYKRICTFITDARYGGAIDWDAIEDRGRTPTIPSDWENISELIDSSVNAYRLPRWNDQEYYVELYCEKQAMESVLKPITRKYHIYFGVNKGYSSASTMYELAQRIKEKIKEGKKSVILYLGDHDPSGLDMIRDVRDRIREFLIGSRDLQDKYWDMEYEEKEKLEERLDNKYGNIYIGDDKELYTSYDDSKDLFLDYGKAYVSDLLEEYFQVVPLALNMTQIKQYAPPPNPAKITDPRADWYINLYGKKSWELDALEPKVLINLAEQGIQRFLDVDKYNVWIEREKKEKEALVKFGKELVEKEGNSLEPKSI